MATVRPVRSASAAAQESAVIANTTAVTNSNNVGDLPATVNAILTALKALGLSA